MTNTSKSNKGLSVNDILFLLFLHKWKIIVFSVIGLTAALGYKYLREPLYESKAKLYVKYVLDRNIDSREDEPISYSPSIINAEIEIFLSLDLSKDVAAIVGPERIIQDSDKPVTVEMAAREINRGLGALSSYHSNIIEVSYKNQDPKLASEVLSHLVNRYYKKHLEVHRSVGAFDFVSEQTDQVRTRLRNTEEELKRLKADGGIVSIQGSVDSIEKRRDDLQDQLLKSEVQVAELQAKTKELEALLGLKSKITDGEEAEGEAAVSLLEFEIPDASILEEFSEIETELDRLKVREEQLASRFAPDNRLVVSIRSQVDNLEKQRRVLISEYPALQAESEEGEKDALDPLMEAKSDRAKLVAAEARIKVLKRQLEELDDARNLIASSSTEIQALERRKQSEEDRLLYFENALETARVDEALDPAKMPNISPVQQPSMAERAASTSADKKIMICLAGGGVGLGVALALFIELVLQRRIRRPLEVEKRLGIGLMLTIPKIETRKPTVPLLGGGTGSALQPSAFGGLRPYAKSIRDRLCYYFDSNNMKHEPKLIALTGLTKGAGTSSLASALAASFSENGQKRVLLVDMSVEPSSGMNLDITKRDLRFREVGDNLYLASTKSDQEVQERLEEESGDQITTNRLYELLPTFRASDFGYIIFDFPEFSPANMTMFMDNVLLVLDSENINQDRLSYAYGELVKGNHNVTCIYNKETQHAPLWLSEAS